MTIIEPWWDNPTTAEEEWHKIIDAHQKQKLVGNPYSFPTPYTKPWKKVNPLVPNPYDPWQQDETEDPVHDVEQLQKLQELIDQLSKKVEKKKAETKENIEKYPTFDQPLERHGNLYAAVKIVKMDCYANENTFKTEYHALCEDRTGKIAKVIFTAEDMRLYGAVRPGDCLLIIAHGGDWNRAEIITFFGKGD